MQWFNDITEEEWVNFNQIVQKLDKILDFSEPVELLIRKMQRMSGNNSFIAMAQSVCDMHEQLEKTNEGS